MVSQWLIDLIANKTFANVAFALTTSELNTAAGLGARLGAKIGARKGAKTGARIEKVHKNQDILRTTDRTLDALCPWPGRTTSLAPATVLLTPVLCGTQKP
jgi:hypothetical protein